MKWSRSFRKERGRGDVKDDSKSGRPSTRRTEENVERVSQNMQRDRRLTVRMIASELNMNCERVRTSITKDPGMAMT